MSILVIVLIVIVLMILILGGEVFAPFYINTTSISEELNCSICTHPFLQPVTLKARYKNAQCNHTFCNECITQWLSQKKDEDHKCPYCQTEVQKKFSIADKPVCNMVDSLKVKCYYFQESCEGGGCTWIGVRSDWATHLAKECAYKVVECSHKQFGCEWSQRRSLLSTHLQQCSYQAVLGLITRILAIEKASEDISSSGQFNTNITQQLSQLENRLDRAADRAEEVQQLAQKMLGSACTPAFSNHIILKQSVKKVIKSFLSVLLLLKEDKDV